jgi:protein gp37
MGQKSAIEWTESTWNPVTGCSKISAGCQNCYAERMAKRLQAMGQANYKNGFQVTLHEPLLELPLHWRKPQMIFVNSMSDLFHEEVPEDFIRTIFGVMQKASWHRFQILTKRVERAAAITEKLPWPDNVWMGVTVENADYLGRIEYLRRIPASVRFLSLEPLIGPIPAINLKGIDWVIVGGESGPGARPMKPEWVSKIKENCQKASVPFFFKQWGGFNKKRNGRTLEGRIYNEMPETYPPAELSLAF